jgi:hypothetical protein
MAEALLPRSKMPKLIEVMAAFDPDDAGSLQA